MASSSDRETVDCPPVGLTRTRSVGRRAAPADDPQRIDRYTVQRRLGVGGMSVVYEALDERIGRRVALKLMLVSDGEAERERLRREAQALARLSHPNVVEVFEIGEHDGRPYVAMALVDGDALDRWLRVQPRSPAEIVEAFVQAGEGLAAAHAHGLVHRDFKPGNVLMGRDGRVRVVDFGLVRESGGAESSSASQLPSPAEISSRTASSAWAESLTRTGAMVGTPAYMSPEQIGGLAVGPASDQFSFCVALYEALYRKHPFVADGKWSQLPYNVLEGRLQRPPVNKKVPKALGKLVMRGLALRPEARWPSMEALLQALRRALDRRGPRLPSLVVGLGLLGVGAGVLQRSAQTPVVDPCEQGAVTMRQAWHPQAREQLRAAWIGTGLPGAADTWDRVDARLQDHAEGWWSIHAAACDGPRHAASSAACLSRWADGLRMHLQLMERPNERLLHNAVQLVGQLPSLDACREALDAPPDEPAVEAPAWQQELDRVSALIAANQFDEAAALVEGLVARAKAEGDARFTAEASLRLGRVLAMRAETQAAAVALEESYLGAKQLGQDRLAAEAALSLLHLHGEVDHRPDEAERWGGHARAETERVADPVLTARYLNAWGRALRSRMKLADALEQHRKALELQRSLPALEPTELALSHFQIGTVLGLTGHVDEGREHLEQALQIQQQELGPRHPRVAGTLTNLGIFLMVDGRDQAALETLTLAYELLKETQPDNPAAGMIALFNISGLLAREGRAAEAARAMQGYLDGLRQMRGPDDIDAAYVELLTCEIAMFEGDHARALEHCRRSLAHEQAEPDGNNVDATKIHQATGAVLGKLGRLHEAVAAQRRARAELHVDRASMTEKDALQLEAETDHELGRALRMAGEHDEALAVLERAGTALVEGPGPSHWRRFEVEVDIGATLLELGRGDEARPRLRAAVTGIEANRGPDALAFQLALVVLAQAELDGGDLVRAREHAERAVALVEQRAAAVPELLARARFVLAQCLHASPQDRARAVALARQAEEALAEQGEAVKRELDGIRAWLAKHDARAKPRRPS